MGLGAFGIRFSKPGKPDIAAYCNDFLRELRDRNSRLRKRYQNLEDGLHFFKVCIIRSEDGDNVAMAATPGSEYGYFQLVFFYENPDDNTSKNRKKTALMVCEDINILAVQHFRYPSEFRYAGDLTDPDKDEYPPPAAKMLDEDVMDFMDTTYSLDHYTRDIQAAELATSFFGSREDAPALIRGWPIRDRIND